MMMCRKTLGAHSPVNYLRLIDLKTRVVGSGQARGVADGTVDVDGFAAGATDRVVVIVTDSILVKCRRPGGLDAPDEALLHQDPQSVVYRLSRNRTNVGTNFPGDIIRRAVGTTRHRPQHSQALRRDVHTVFAKKFGWIISHPRRIRQNLDSVKN